MRKKTRLDSAAVQGDGSWVELKAPSWEQSRPFLAGINSQPDGLGLEMAEEMVPMCIKAWNWTDDNDQPLPLPADPKSLTLDEMMWLIPHLSKFLTPEKN